MTWLLASLAILLWIVALYRLSRNPTKAREIQTPLPEYVSREWLAQFRRSREE
jgi:hypothetical protein